jgi:predicted membrane-bound spermidine synthase
VPNTAEGRGPRILLLLVAAGLAGAGVMTVELAAVRLIAPRFGASSAVWTNVIGVVLLALSLGYLVGARVSRGANPARALGRVLLLGAVLVAWLPSFSGPVCSVLFPDGTALDEAVGLLVWGSLAASMVLFLPAATVLGCAAPLCTEALQRLRGGGAGESGGRVLAASTAGSLAGAFGTTYVLVPNLGMTGIFLTAGAVLAVAGLALLLTTRSIVAAAVLIIPLGLAFGFSRTSERPVAEGETLLAQTQSAYQSLRVVEAGTGDERIRRLEVNEGLDSFQSVWIPQPGLLGQGYYYDLFALPPFWDTREESVEGPDRWSTLILGLGAGTTVRVMEGAMPEGVALSTVGVELDPAVVELALEHFDLDSGPDREVHGGLDARVALNHVARTFDQVALDCYANQVEIPPHLATVEFFREVRDVLRPGGWLSINAAGFGLDDPVVDAVARTCATAFEQPILVVRVPFSRNCMLFARRDAQVAGPDDEVAWHRPGARFHALLRRMELGDAWRQVEPNQGTTLTDAQSPMERLQLESLTDGRKRWLEAKP